MKHKTHPVKKMSIFERLKSHSIALANLLVAIVTLLSVAHGLTISDAMALMSPWCLTGVTTLLMLTIVLNYTGLVKLIRTLKRSLSGGKQTSIKHSKS